MITVDITTKNTVFDPLSGQGSWIQHRFGQRNYPCLDLNLDCITEIINSHDIIFLRSVYGDPLCHPEIKEIIGVANKMRKTLIIFSYLNTSNSEVLDQILQSETVSVYVPVDGFENYGCTILDSNKSTVFENLIKLGSKATVEFLLYSYNINDLKDLREFCDTHGCLLKTHPGRNFGLPVTSIVNKDGHWLYDVFPLTSELDAIWDNRVKEKTVEGYRSLLDYVGKIEGISILDDPAITKIFKTDESFNDDMPAVSVTGHVFKNTESMFAFSNALCTDWAINTSTLSKQKHQLDNYTILIGKTLNEILDKGLQRFSNSNI